MMTRGFLPLLAIVAATGIAALAWETDGFRVVTSAGARQLSIERTPLPLPDVRLVDQDGHAFSLSSYKGRPVLVDFIYTRCPKMRLPVAGNRAKKIGASSGRCAACSATAQDTVRRMIPSGCHSHKHVK